MGVNILRNIHYTKIGSIIYYKQEDIMKVLDGKNKEE